MFSFSVVLNSKNLTNLVQALKSSFTVFGSKHVDEHVKKNYHYLEEKFECLGGDEELIDDGDDSNFEIDANETLNGADNDEQMIREIEKPFKPYLIKETDDAHYCTDSSKPTNPFFVPQWINLLKNKWFSQTPFWSSILRGLQLDLITYNCLSKIF